ncbi:hypothetical protein acdb102_30930 [Acidothermaceae bacterium B102]|nr:hypothetical protein acdb102_30930 [Acidothermaceae bacterium B102]
MADQPGTLEVIARELAVALGPLEDRLAAGNAEAFLRQLGIVVPGAFDQAATAVENTAVKAAALAPLVVALVTAIEAEDASAIITASIPLIGGIRDLLSAVSALEPALKAALAAVTGLTPAQVTYLEAEMTALPGRLVEWMLIEYLEIRVRGVADTLAMFRIIDDVQDPGDPTDPVKPPLLRRSLRLDRIVSAFTSPSTYLSDAFRFGEADFDGMPLFKPLADFLDSLELAVALLTPPSMPPILEAFVLRLSSDPATHPPSLTAELRLPATQDVTKTIPIGGNWSVTLSVGARFDAGVGITVTPPFQLELQPPTGSITAQADVGVAAARPDGTPMILLGEAGGSRLELATFAAALGVTGSAGIGAPVSVEPNAKVGITGGRLLIDLSQGDGFISTIAGGVHIDSNLDLAALWSPSTGLTIQGSGGIEIAIPSHISLGPIEITSLYLKLSLASDASIPIELSGAFSAELGPLQASVDRIGMVATFRFPPGGGNLGPVDVGFAFKPPNGIGLAVDAGVVTGGGYLYIDTERGEYDGILELDIAGIVSVKAIGLITTRNPDGSPGFSLLLVITAEFGTGIQLGFGFTLLGVGGILGLNRAMNLPALVSGVQDNSISSVMFPQDVIANAPKIISDLRTFFPTQQGTFVIGPMAKIGWGTPTLVSLSLGIIIEIPGNIAILGVLKVALPADDVAVIELQVNFIGAIEFDKKRVYFFASIFDSHILFLTIEGQMAVLAAFGDDANFVLSVGGFHPAFQPPPLPVPVPQRITIDIINTTTAKLRVEGYFAVTTNTAQFGARLDLTLGFSDFGIQGNLTFDALIQFSPFQFVIDISASVSLHAFGFDVMSIQLSLELSGPTPWRAKGTGSISLLFWSIDVDFDETFGGGTPTTLPDITVLPLLGDEFDKLASWRTLLPTGIRTLVSLRALDPAVDVLVLHPVGVLQVSQRLVPLDLTITKVGNSKAADANRFSLEVVGNGLAKKGDVLESFAPAQFRDLDDATKLSSPAFESDHGGIELSASGDDLRSGALVARVLRYEVITVDTGWRRFARSFQVVVPGLFELFTKGAAAARTPLSQQHTTLLQPFADKVTVAPESYVVASTADNSTVASFPSKAMAMDHLADRLAADPTLGGALHVVPAFEAVA